MARFSHNTAAGAGLGVGGIVPHRSIPINMESTLRRTQKGHVFRVSRSNNGYIS